MLARRAERAQTQLVVTTLAVIAIVQTRSLHSVYIAVGATGAAFLAKILKRFVRQPRPDRSAKETYGMPSTHSTSISFFGTYLFALILLAPDSIRGVHPAFAHLLPFAHANEPLPPFVAWPLAVTILVGAASVCWSRIYLGHHTVAQVCAGASLGTLCSAVALALWIGVDRLGEDRTLPARLASAPLLVAGGVRQHAPSVERFVDDSASIVLDAWKQRDARRLADLGGGAQALYNAVLYQDSSK